MPTNRLHVVSFGSANGGLTTVGFTVYNPDGTQFQARSTSGVVEYGTSTGIYGANIALPDSANVVILWDTGGVSPRYAVEESRNQLNQIQESTDIIRMIWNTLRNQGDVFQSLIDKINNIKTQKDLSSEFSKISGDIKKAEGEILKINSLVKSVGDKIPTTDDIKKSLNVVVKPTDVNLSAPDYTSDIKSIKDSVSKSEASIVSNIASNKNAIIVELVSTSDSIKSKIYSEANSIKSDISSLKKIIPSDVKGAVGSIINMLRDMNSGIEKKHLQVSKALVSMWNKFSPQSMTISMYTALDNVRAENERKREADKIKKDLGING